MKLLRKLYCFFGWHGWTWKLSEEGTLSLSGPPPGRAICEHCGVRYGKEAEVIPESILVPFGKCPGYPDYPTAWAIQTDRGESLAHGAKCSSVAGHHQLSGPAFLCDCGAVENEWKRLKSLFKEALTA